MLNQVILKIQQVNSLFLGFIIISAVLIGLVIYKPAVTECDIQMEVVNEGLAKNFFNDDTRGGGFEKGIMSAFNNCLNSNSPGGCHDMFSRFDFMEGLVKSIPTNCGNHVSTAKIQVFLAKGLRLFGMIAWGEEPPVNKYNKTGWLDTADLGLYCRLKRQYQRLYGNEAFQSFVYGFLPKLPGIENLPKKQALDLSLYTYPCKGLY